MAEYKVMNQSDLSRLSQVEVQALDETKGSLKAINNLIESYNSLIKSLEDLPKRLNEDVMVPLGTVAYMPGRLVNVDWVTMLLGDNWFIDTPTKDAQSVVRRRIKALQGHLDKLKEQERLFSSRLEYTEEFIKEENVFGEVMEECTEEEHEKFMEQHGKNVRKSREKEKKSDSNHFDLEDFFKRYKDDDDDEDDVARTSKSDENAIHEGYRSLLADLEVDCSDIDFVGSKEEVATEANGSNARSGDPVEEAAKHEGSRLVADEMEDGRPQDEATCPSRSSDIPSESADVLQGRDGLTDDLEKEVVDEAEEEDGICQEGMNKFDKSLEMDAGFKLLLQKLGLSQEEGIGSASPGSSREDEESLAYAKNCTSSRSDSSSEIRENGTTANRLIGEEKCSPADGRAGFNKPKKSVSWKDEVVANNRDDGNKEKEKDDNDDEDRGDENDEDKPATIVLRFKHSNVMPAVSFPHPSEEQDANVSIVSPKDIYTKVAYKPQSILKPSREAEVVRKGRQSNTKAPPPKTEARPAHVKIRHAVSARVVERTVEPDGPSQTEVPARQELKPATQENAPKVSKFKMDMARKNRKQS